MNPNPDSNEDYIYKSYLESRRREMLPYLPRDIVDLTVSNLQPTRTDLKQYSSRHLFTSPRKEYEHNSKYIHNSYLEFRRNQMLPYLPSDIVDLTVSKLRTTHRDLLRYTSRHLLERTIDPAILFQGKFKEVINALINDENMFSRFIKEVSECDRYWNNPLFKESDYDAFDEDAEDTVKETEDQINDRKMIYKYYNHLYTLEDDYKTIQTRRDDIMKYMLFIFELFRVREKLNVYELTHIVDTHCPNLGILTFRILCMYFKHEYDILLPTTFSYLMFFKESEYSAENPRAKYTYDALLGMLSMAAQRMHLDIVVLFWDIVVDNAYREILFSNIFEGKSDLECVPDTSALEWFLGQCRTLLFVDWWLVVVHSKSNRPLSNGKPTQNNWVRLEFILDLALRREGDMFRKENRFDKDGFLLSFLVTQEKLEPSRLWYVGAILKHPLFLTHNLDRVRGSVNDLIAEHNDFEYNLRANQNEKGIAMRKRYVQNVSALLGGGIIEHEMRRS